MDITPHILEMIRRSSCDLSLDVVSAIKKGRDAEEIGSSARTVLETIIENIELATAKSTPICQDTGTLIFYVDYPEGGSERFYSDAIKKAVREATQKLYLRPNAVEPILGKNSGDNIGVNSPYIHFHQWDNDHVRIRFMQKGGGCENCGAQYRLPDVSIKAGRDLAGVRNAILDSVYNAQGLGCAPGVLGVGIGGDRSLSQALAKEQLFRKIGERSGNEELAKLEVSLKEDINRLGIGPMGFGGKTTVLDVLIGSQHRHPATFYVSISYMCWANRRKSLVIKGSEVIHND